MTDKFDKARLFLLWQAAQPCDEGLSNICFPCKAADCLEQLGETAGRGICFEKPTPPVCPRCEGEGRTWK